MWEKTELSMTGRSDETAIIPAIRNDVTGGMKEETESDRLTAARNRGVTIGLLVMGGLFAACAIGVGIGAFLMRVLVL